MKFSSLFHQRHCQKRSFFSNSFALFAGRGTSDPFAVVTKLTHPPTLLGRTEIIENSLSPNWVKIFVLDYELGTPFEFAVSVFDSIQGQQSKPMGSVVFDLGEVLGARGSTKAKHFDNGTIFATARKSTGSGTLRFKFKGESVSILLACKVAVFLSWLAMKSYSDSGSLCDS